MQKQLPLSQSQPYQDLNQSQESVSVRVMGQPLWTHRERSSLQSPLHPPESSVQTYVLRHPELKHEEIEIVLRGRELVVRQPSIYLEKTYPLHARVDTEKITAKYKSGALEIKIPDKAAGLRAFYAAQMRERDWMKKQEEQEDATLLAQDASKNRMALDKEREAHEARRRARAEIEAYNRSQAKFQRRNPFPMPESFGYLLYNRKEYEGPGGTLPPDMLRTVLDTQIAFKNEQSTKEKEKDRIIVEQQVKELQAELEETERKQIQDKINKQKGRMAELTHQMNNLPPKLPGAFTAVCDFPRMDNEDKAQAVKREALRKIQDEVVTMVHEKGQAALEAKKTQYKEDMAELQAVQRELDEEEASKLANNANQKQKNRHTWQEQIDTKRRQVCADYVESLYNTSLPIGDAELRLVKTIRQTTEVAN